MAVQRTVLQLDEVGTDDGDLRAQGDDAVVRFRNWPDVPSHARKALDAHLERMESLAISTICKAQRSPTSEKVRERWAKPCKKLQERPDKPGGK